MVKRSPISLSLRSTKEQAYCQMRINLWPATARDRENYEGQYHLISIFARISLAVTECHFQGDGPRHIFLARRYSAWPVQ